MRIAPAASRAADEPEAAAARPLRSMPPRAPIEMPTQDLRTRPAGFASRPDPLIARRLLLIGASIGVAVLAGAVLADVLGVDGLSPLEWATIVLSAVLSGWVAFGSISAAAGFFVALSERRETSAAAAAVPAANGARTAILLPTYNEDPGLILSAVEAIGEDLARLGAAHDIDIFILSDTRQDAIARAEEVGLLRLRGRAPGLPEVYYRRRLLNTDKKAGNIGQWVEAHGGAYAHMLVLDADSLMTGETILSLIAAMDADPGLGLLQTVPTIVGAETPFARVQQFASRLYGPVFACGQQWWSGSEGNYWGHNALIRVKAFAESCGLPHLTGPRPFGGHILSHDFVEAALLRRQGWTVRTWAELGGSYEETPPTLLDTATRDRRWCQGNLQHARLLTARGLHWVSRLHLLVGIFAYLAPAFWFALLLGDALVWPSETLGDASGRRVADLFAMSMAFLILPKALALILALGSPSLRRGFGGAPKLVLGFAAESLVSLITTPVMMVMQTAAVVEVLLGQDSGWSAQRREGSELSREDAWRAHGWHVFLGVGGAIASLVVSKYLLLWASPVFLSLALSALMSLHTSRRRTDRRRARGLFQIPEDAEPPTVVARALELRNAYAAEAADRRRIDQLMREPAAVYEPSAAPVILAERQKLVA